MFQKTVKLLLKNTSFIFSPSNSDHFLVTDVNGVVTIFSSTNLKEVAEFHPTSSRAAVDEVNSDFKVFVRVGTFFDEILKNNKYQNF